MAQGTTLKEQYFVVLSKDDPISWALMPHVLDRIQKFCVKYTSDINGVELAKVVQCQFVLDDPIVVCAAAYEKGKGVFAHALASIDDITGNKFLTIIQMEADQPFKDRETVNNIWQQLRTWGLRHSADEARLVTRSLSHVKLFERFYGFKLHRYTMFKSLMED